MIPPKISLSSFTHNTNAASDMPVHIEGGQSLWKFLAALESSAILPPGTLHICVFPDPQMAENFYGSLTLSKIDIDLVHLETPEVNPPLQSIPSERSIYSMFSSLTRVVHHSSATKPLVIITDLAGLHYKAPPKAFFLDHFFTIKIDDIISPSSLSSKLLSLGFMESPSVEAPGQFSSRGEIFDIFPLGNEAFRITYFDDLIETIHKIDLLSQRTIRDETINEFSVGPTPQIFLQKKFISAFRDNIPIPSPQKKARFNRRKQCLDGLNSGILFPDYPLFLPLFFTGAPPLIDYFSDLTHHFHFFNFSNGLEHLQEWFKNINVKIQADEDDTDSINLIQNIEQLFERNISFKKTNHSSIFFQLDHLVKGSHKIESLSDHFLDQGISALQDKSKALKILDFIDASRDQYNDIYFATTDDKQSQQLKYLFEVGNVSPSLRRLFKHIQVDLETGFYLPEYRILVLGDRDILPPKSKVSKSRSRPTDLFTEQFAALSEGDFVVHAEHGIGVYRGLGQIDSLGPSNDFAIVEYQAGDRVYVPTYKFHLLQKFADSTSTVKIENLRSSKFNKIKNRARESAKKLAFDLIKLQAKRQSQRGFSFSAPDDLFNYFADSFPFKETPDQLKAIEEVLEKMQSPLPMDCLVCGDVGHGKTEVAMRAAYKAVLDGKQVVVLVPTTILALQHYHTFQKRFLNTATSIDFLSRFKSKSEEKETLEKISNGNIDILISTHKVLSEKVSFKDLGLVIVDEEHRFGVAHKEKLKLLKQNVDFLTLTATPIPRTLQLSFLGIRDISLIQTPPPNRQSIKTYIIYQDNQTIKNAIEQELSRGGQVYIIHNRVQDIEIYLQSIQQLVPHAKIVFAHGQLSERELEKRITDFYLGKYQILISTTIIESGIDIPNANTMIINRADALGLAQLHQLRGRIGRSERKAYCYFVIPPTNKILNADAEKRIRALEKYSELGSGLGLANCDLEIRGAGDILGAEQSGHLQSVGLELYLELLKEAIAELKGDAKIIRKDFEITTPWSAFIPTGYIRDVNDRLKYYKKLSISESLEAIDDISSEIADRFGSPPPEFNTLLEIIKSRLYLQVFPLKRVYVTSSSITLVFDESLLKEREPLRDKILDLFLSRGKRYQFTPDFKLIYSGKEIISSAEFLNFAKDIHIVFSDAT